MNILGDALDARRAGYDEMQRGHETRARNRAGRKLATRDYGGAAGELYGAGMLAEGAGVEAVQQRQQDRQLDLRRDERKLEHEEMQQRAEALIKVSTALQHVPPGERLATLQKLTPALGQIMDVSPFKGLTEDQLTDENLRLFGAEVASKIKTYSSGGRTVAVDEGALQRDFQDQGAVRVLDQDPLAAEYKRAQIGATEARAEASMVSAEAARARAFRSRNPVSRGGGGGGGFPGPPPGYRPK